MSDIVTTPTPVQAGEKPLSCVDCDPGANEAVVTKIAHEDLLALEEASRARLKAGVVVAP
jgi:hypothetical protein